MSDSRLVDVHPDENGNIHIPLMTFEYVPDHKSTEEEIVKNLSQMVLQKIFRLIPLNQIDISRTVIPVRIIKSACFTDTGTKIKVGFMTIIPR